MDDVEMARPGRPAKKEENLEDTEYRPVNWKKVFLSPKYIPWHLLAIAIIVITVLITIRHDQAVEKLRPFSEKVRDLPAGWLIPIAILILISFPPLFGHEIVALLCGVVYGLWIGFGIVSAGTFFGEVGTWFAFKHALRRRAQKLEKTNLNYGALARLTRDGGFWVILLIRFSAIPSHFSTAVFSTCDVNFWYFAIATFLTLPKQLILVYFGVLLVQAQSDSTPKTIVVAVSGLVTILMAVYIWFKMTKFKKILLEEQAARRARRENGQPKVDGSNESLIVEARLERERREYLSSESTQYPLDPREAYPLGAGRDYSPAGRSDYGADSRSHPSMPGRPLYPVDSRDDYALGPRVEDPLDDRGDYQRRPRSNSRHWV